MLNLSKGECGKMSYILFGGLKIFYIQNDGPPILRETDLKALKSIRFNTRKKHFKFISNIICREFYESYKYFNGWMPYF